MYMANDKTLYTKDSIESLDPLQFTRLKPQVYAGDCTYATQLLVEILSNAVDEYRLGHGEQIDITINDNIVKVSDQGQGFIYSMRDDKKSILEAAFSVLNTSGKYREDGTYEGTSLGSFGIGSKLTTFLSHWLTVTSRRDGVEESIHFVEGVFNKRSVKQIDKKMHGTTVEWQASEEFFTYPNVELEKVNKLCYTIACLCPGLAITVNGNRFYSINGLNDLADKDVKNKEIITNRFNMKFDEGKNHLDMVMTYTSNYSTTIIPYVNTGLTESGPHITTIKTLITREFNKFFREKKWLKDNDDNLSGDDINEGMYLVFNITTPNVGYDAQVKSRITKISLTPFTPAIANELQVWCGYHEKELKIIVDKAIQARKAREAAKKARENVRTQTKKKEKALKFDSKLADCWSTDREKCEIYITEGDSASANLKTARNNEFQAVMPVRGKIINTQKATLVQIQKNAEIMTMIDAFGLKVNPNTMKITYDPAELRYGKIIIMSDADVDGAHIKNLFYTFIWNFCPQLIEDGYIYAGVPPLYKVTIGKTYYYLKDDNALEEFKKEHPNSKLIVNRFKGLGELDADETEETLTDPNNRIIKQITADDIKATSILFEELMGTGVTARKAYIKEHSKEATYNAE